MQEQKMIQKSAFYGVFLWLISFLSVSLTAEPNIFYSYGNYPDKTQTYTFGDKVNVREKPSLKAKTLGQLPIAAPVTVISTAPDSLTLNGYEEKWVLVSYEANGKTEQGYVWGGMLAKFALELPSGGLVLAGIIKADAESFKKTVELRWVLDQKVISTLNFEAVEMADNRAFGYSMGGEYLGKKGFGELVFFQVAFVYEACDYPNGKVLIAADLKNKKLYYALTGVTATGEGGGVSVDLTFPSDPGGKPNQIRLLRSFYTRADPETGQGEKTEETVEIYAFNGQEFKKQ